MDSKPFSRRACPPCGELTICRNRGGQARRLNVTILAILAILAIGLLWWFDPAEIDLPVCTFRAWTGLDCPSCGATRATHELLHGRLLAAWHYNALWVLSLPLAAYVALSECRVMAGGRPLPGDLARRAWFWISLAAVAAVFFVSRNLPYSV
jgi:hypothetical protein